MGLVDELQEGFTSALNLETVLPSILMIIGAVIVFKKSIQRMKQELAKNNSTSSDDAPSKLAQSDDRKSPIWDFSYPLTIPHAAYW